MPKHIMHNQKVTENKEHFKDSFNNYIIFKNVS